MNIILFSAEELKNDQLTLTDHRHHHIKKLLKPAIGDTLHIGQIDGQMGHGTVHEISDTQTVMIVSLNITPPTPLPIKLIIALPRPKVFKRIAYNVATLGVKELHIINSWRVEKAYWNSPAIEPAYLEPYFLEGICQAKDTIMPTVQFHRYYSNFAKEVLPEISKDTDKWVAHPYDGNNAQPIHNSPTTLIIGPEGGFIEREIETFEDMGFHRLQIGDRILKVETAVTASIAKLCL